MQNKFSSSTIELNPFLVIQKTDSIAITQKLSPNHKKSKHLHNKKKKTTKQKLCFKISNHQK